MINEELKEVLSELINIAFGSATATIADLFDSFATLRVPGIQVVPIADVKSLVLEGTEEEIYITSQQFHGGFKGEIAFTLDSFSARKILEIVNDIDGNTDYDENETEVRQSVLEIANILGSSCVGKLSELLESNVTFAPPSIEYTRQVLSRLDDASYSHIVVISTVLEFKEMKFMGRLFILFTDEMFQWLEKSLQDFLDNI